MNSNYPGGEVFIHHRLNACPRQKNIFVVRGTVFHIHDAHLKLNPSEVGWCQQSYDLEQRLS